MPAHLLSVSLYGWIVSTYLLLQAVFALLEHRRHRRRKHWPRGLPVTVVVPAFNPDVEGLRACVRSLLDQDYPGLVEVIVVDDGSAKPFTEEDLGMAAPLPDERSARLIRLPAQAGKRRAQKAAFDCARGAYIATVDDDTVLERDALARLVAVIEADEGVGAVSASIRVRNRGTNLLTLLIDLRYWAANHLERASQSYFGVVHCCSGPLAIYRADLVARLAEEYVSQRFLGRLCTYGDDRHLTNLVLREGCHVRFAPSARAWTACPETISVWLRQQRRWSKSFYREAWWSLRFIHRRNVYFGYNLLVGALLPFLLCYGLACAALHLWRGEWWLGAHYLAMIVGMAWIRALCGIAMTRDPAFLLMPLYAFLHLALVVPVRVLALCTLWDTRWGTR